MRQKLRRIEPEEVTFEPSIESIELMDIKEAAAFLKVSVTTMRRLQQQREVSFIKVGGAVRFAKSDIVSYIIRKRVAAIHELV
jgi:excisionase family DNA binding protein